MPVTTSQYPISSRIEFALHATYVASILLVLFSLWSIATLFGGVSHGSVLDSMFSLLMPILAMGAFLVFAFPVVIAIGLSALAFAVYRLIKKLPIKWPVLQWVFLLLEVISLAIAITSYANFYTYR